jgi:hypothetical protein
VKINSQTKKLRQLRALERARDLVVVNLRYGYHEAATAAMRELRRVSVQLEQSALPPVWPGAN